MTQPTAQQVTFTMKIDASDLRRLFASQSGGGGVQGPAGQLLGGTMGQNGSGGGGSAQAQQNNFRALFKPLAVLYGIEKVMSGLLRNSTVANTYMGAMGKMFGAAIDILLIPFIPLFNLIMVGISKLIMWLITSGYLEKMTKIMEEVAKNISGMVKWVAEMAKAIKDFDVGKIASLMAVAVKEVVKESVQNPGVALATAATLGVGYLMARNMPILGGAIKMGERAIGFGTSLIFGRGAAGAPASTGAGGGGAGVPPIIGGAGGAAARGGVMRAVGGKALPALGFGLLAYEGAGMLSNAAGVKNNYAKEMLKGAAGGAVAGGIIGSAVPVIGTGIGAAAGGVIGGGLGFFKAKMSGGGGQQMAQGGVPAGGMSMVNSNNTINFTMNNTFTGGDTGQAVTVAVQEMERRTGYVLAGKSSSPSMAKSIASSAGQAAVAAVPGLGLGMATWKGAKKLGGWLT